MVKFKTNPQYKGHMYRALVAILFAYTIPLRTQVPNQHTHIMKQRVYCFLDLFLAGISISLSSDDEEESEEELEEEELSLSEDESEDELEEESSSEDESDDEDDESEDSLSLSLLSLLSLLLLLLSLSLLLSSSLSSLLDAAFLVVLTWDFSASNIGKLMDLSPHAPTTLQCKPTFFLSIVIRQIRFLFTVRFLLKWGQDVNFNSVVALKMLTYLLFGASQYCFNVNL